MKTAPERNAMYARHGRPSRTGVFASGNSCWRRLSSNFFRVTFLAGVGGVARGALVVYTCRPRCCTHGANGGGGVPLLGEQASRPPRCLHRPAWRTAAWGCAGARACRPPEWLYNPRGMARTTTPGARQTPGSCMARCTVWVAGAPNARATVSRGAHAWGQDYSISPERRAFSACQTCASSGRLSAV